MQCTGYWPDGERDRAFPKLRRVVITGLDLKDPDRERVDEWVDGCLVTGRISMGSGEYER